MRHTDPRPSVPARVAVAADVLKSPLAGLRRYVAELLPRLAGLAEPIVPNFSEHRFRGRRLLWEQVSLPVRLRGRLLWSPTNTGPLATQRQVLTIHDLVWLDHPDWLNGAVVRCMKLIQPLLARRVMRVIANSEFTKGRIISAFGLNPARVSVAHLGVAPRFRPTPHAETASARKALGIPGSDYVLYLGTLEPRKNLARLLDAWQSLLPELSHLPGLWLVIAGAMGQEKDFGQFSLRHVPERAYLCGHVEDQYLPGLYSGARAFVYPSLYEGFGIPPLEAMACGVPVIASDIPPVREVVADSGILFDPFDADSLAKAVRLVVVDKDLSRKLALRGPARAAAFTWDHCAEKVRTVLEECLDEPPGPRNRERRDRSFPTTDRALRQ